MWRIPPKLGIVLLLKRMNSCDYWGNLIFNCEPFRMEEASIQSIVKTNACWEWLTLAGWWFQPTPLKKMSSSVGMMTCPTEWKHKIHVPNHQPDMYSKGWSRWCPPKVLGQNQIIKFPRQTSLGSVNQTMRIYQPKLGIMSQTEFNWLLAQVHS